MDHKVSKDMISSGMIPSGEKTQADLGRTQYGSAPSPSSLMDAYRTIYEHHQKDADGNVIPHEEKEELNEGKMPEGLKNYLMKKKGKKEDKKEDMKKEGADLFDIVKSNFIYCLYETIFLRIIICWYSFCICFFYCICNRIRHCKRCCFICFYYSVDLIYSSIFISN